MTPNEKSPAFPSLITKTRDYSVYADGLTKLEWMSGIIAAGIISNPEVKRGKNSDFAEIAVAIARAVLEEVNKEK